MVFRFAGCPGTGFNDFGSGGGLGDCRQQPALAPALCDSEGRHSCRVGWNRAARLRAAASMMGRPGWNRHGAHWLAAYGANHLVRPIDAEARSCGIRRKDIAAVAAARPAPAESVALRSSMDYAARGGCGDPRGRNSCAGSGIVNLRLPMWAEGEKRFRSATRNP